MSEPRIEVFVDCVVTTDGNLNRRIITQKLALSQNHSTDIAMALALDQLRRELCDELVRSPNKVKDE